MTLVLNAWCCAAICEILLFSSSDYLMPVTPSSLSQQILVFVSGTVHAAVSSSTYPCDPVLGRNQFVQTGFGLYPKTGLGFLVQKKWTVSIPHINTSVKPWFHVKIKLF